MSIEITTNAKPVESAPAAAQPIVEAEQSAPADEVGEITEESDASENEQDQESDEDEDSEQQDQEHKDDAKKPVKKNSLQKRFGKLTKRAADAEAQAEYWRKQAEGKAPQEIQPDKKTPAKPEGEPNPNDFETNADFIKAYTKWELAEEKRVANEEKQANEVRNSQAKLERDHSARVTKFMETATDYNEVVENFKEKHGAIQWPYAIAETLMSSEYGPNILYEVMKKPGEFERIAQMSPVAQIRELGKLEARIADKLESATPIQPKTTKAPAPLKPLGSNASGSAKKSIYDPNISQADYEKLRKEQLSRKA